MNEQHQNNCGGQNNGGGGKFPKNSQTVIILVITALMTLFSVSMLSSWFRSSTTEQITYSDFIKMLDEHKVAAVQIDRQSYKFVMEPAEHKEE